MSDVVLAEAADPAADHEGDRDASALPELLALSARGEQDAFADLYRIAAPRLFGMAHRVLGDAALAEEVTQEAFMVIWSTCASFDPARGSAIGWMLTITHRRAIDRVRSAQASSKREEAWGMQSQGTARDGAADPTESAIDAVRVRAALRRLGSNQRMAIFLAYYVGHTYKEVAASMGIHPVTAATRIRTGLLALGELLATPAEQHV